MGARQKPSRWDGVVPEAFENYVGLCVYQFGLMIPRYVRVEINARMGEDVDQEILCLALEAYNKRLDVPQASRLFRNSLRRFVCRVGGWKHGYIKKERRNYWLQVEKSNTLSTEWSEEGEHFDARVYRRLGIPGGF